MATAQLHLNNFCSYGGLKLSWPVVCLLQREAKGGMIMTLGAHDLGRAHSVRRRACTPVEHAPTSHSKVSRPLQTGLVPRRPAW
jgi:hypothetical protein